MNKITGLIVITSLFAFLLGCSNEIVCKCMPNCVFPDAQSVAAPDWLCEAEPEGYEISAIGVTPREKAVASISFTNQIAAEDARTKLLSHVQKVSENTIKKYFETTAITIDQQVINKITTSVSHYITRETLIGTKKLKRIISPTATTYVLLGMSSESVEKTIQKAIKTSMKNEPELWQQFKTRKDLGDLASTIVK